MFTFFNIYQRKGADNILLLLYDELTKYYKEVHQMKLNLLRAYIPLLQEHMQKRNFSKSYIKRHIQMAGFIHKRTSQYDWETFEDVSQWFQGNDAYTKRYIKDSLQVLFNLEYFVTHTCFPCRGTVKKELLYQTSSLGTLDMIYLQNHLGELLSYMEQHDYSESSIRRLRFIANRVIVLSRTIEWNSYDDILAWYVLQNHKRSYMKGVIEVLGILEAFHNRHEMPNNRATQNRLCLIFNNYSILNPTFQKLIDLSINIFQKRGLKPSTIAGLKSVVSTFFASMQKEGANNLENISSDMILQYFAPYTANKAGIGILYRLRTFFATILPFDAQCARILNSLPSLNPGRKNIQYLTEAESNAFCNALRDFNNGLSFKTRAIGTILFYTGLRKSDIINLTFDSISFKNNTINICQQKTGQLLELPLSPIVGNAIYDYCVNERPVCDECYLFVGKYAPHRKNGVGSVTNAIESIMKKAKIRQQPGDRKGSHIFRHRAATEMISNNISPAVVSHTLGHSSPTSLDSYLYADVVHLRECALSIEKFPLAEEVFNHVC